MIEEINAVVAVISTVIGLIITIYKVFLKNTKRAERYHEDILKPFIKDYRKKKNVNVIKFLNKKAERDNDAIPKYIFYLKDKGKEKAEDLKKILLYDYSDIYPNDNNKILRLLEMISKCLVFGLFVMSFSFSIYGAVCLSFGLISLSQFFLWNNMVPLEVLGLSIICFAVSMIVMQMTRVINVDMYTLNEKRIQRIIERKIKCYDKNSAKYIL